MCDSGERSDTQREAICPLKMLLPPENAFTPYPWS